MKLQEWLNATGRSQNQFAGELGVDQRNINRLCRGLHGASLRLAGKIVEFTAKNPAPRGGYVYYDDLEAPSDGRVG